MREQRNLIMLLAGIIAGILIGTMWIGVTADAKMIKEYVGELTCTTYHVSDNTPRGSRATSSGERATEYHTIAVDMHNPMFKQGQKLYVEGFGDGVVEDVGNFGWNGVHLDLFVPEDMGFKKPCKVWIYRPETKAEKKERLRKAREKRRKGKYLLMYDSTLLPWQIKTDPYYIKGGTVQIGWWWCDVVGTEQGLGKVIKTGWHTAAFVNVTMELGEIFENAVG